MEKITGKHIFIGNRTQTAANELNGRLIVINPEKYLYESDGGTYLINYSKHKKTCSCHDFLRHLHLDHTGKFKAKEYICKHILAVESICGLISPEVTKEKGIITISEPNQPLEYEYVDIESDEDEWGKLDDYNSQMIVLDEADDEWTNEEQ